MEPRTNFIYPASFDEFSTLDVDLELVAAKNWDKARAKLGKVWAKLVWSLVLYNVLAKLRQGLGKAYFKLEKSLHKT